MPDVHRGADPVHFNLRRAREELDLAIAERDPRQRKKHVELARIFIERASQN